ncbi:MAG: hypothetical protein JWQ43_2374 [Glaciihabitans sp.]|nr:hypothetical protein [Glaciihabitans sp.]
MSAETIVITPSLNPGPDVRQWTGIAAIAVAVLLLAEFIVRESIGGRPELSDGAALVDFIVDTHTQTLLVIMIDTFLMAGLIVFLAGFRQIITHSDHNLEWIADLAFGSGLVFVGVTLVGDSMEAGTSLVAVTMTPDPAVLVALTAGHMLMFGSIGCVLTALVAAASGYVTHASGALPRWTGWVAYGSAILNIIAVPTMFGGTSDHAFVSAGGPGVAIFATFPWLFWVVAVGIVTIRGRRHSVTIISRRHPQLP